MAIQKDNAFTPIQHKILKAAAKLFADKGFGQTSMHDVATEADCSVPTIYTVFSGKQALLNALFEQMESESKLFYNIPFPFGLNIQQKLEILLRKHFEWTECHKDSFLLLVRREPLAFSKVRKEHRTPTSHVQALTGWLAENDKDGELARFAYEDCAYMLWGITVGVFHHWINNRTNEPLTNHLHKIIRFFFYGVNGTSQQESQSKKPE